MKFDDFKDKQRFTHAVVIPTLLKNGYIKKAEKLKWCGRFKSITICEDCKTAYFNGANSCKDRFCPICQKKRSLLWLAKLYPIFENLIKRGYYVNFVTLTVKDTKKLSTSLNLLNNAFRYIQNTDKTMRKQFNELYIGGIRALEIKTGKNSRLWHPHLHMLVVKNKKSNFKDDLAFLRPAWIKSLKMVGSTEEVPGNVDIQSLRIDNKFRKESLIKAICECFKYLTKSSWNNEVEDICEMIDTLTNVRSLNSWGNIKYYLAKQNAEAQIEKEMGMNNTELKHHVCKFCGCDRFEVIEGIYSSHLLVHDFE